MQIRTALLLFSLSSALPCAAAALGDDRALAKQINAQIRALQSRAQPLAQPGLSPRVSRERPGHWVVDLGADVLPVAPTGQIPVELDERLQALRIAVITGQAPGTIDNLAFRFSGVPLDALFDDTPTVDPAATERTAAGPVFVAASHGYYFNYRFNDWRLQRPVSNGIVEDLTTPHFASRLAEQLRQRGFGVAQARSLQSGQHEVAGKPWWQMASRYHSEHLYPSRPDIWRSYADRSTPLREYNDDIRSRPLLANELGAQALVHLHTNASASPSARGTMAFHQPGRGQDRRLGHVMLCALRAALREVPAYRGYPVRVQPTEGNYGENRLAAAPSILFELGFHTNVEDAKLLSNPDFQKVAARGLAIGYQAFLAGQGSDGRPVCN